MLFNNISTEDIINWIKNEEEEKGELYDENHALREEINHLKFISRDEEIKELKDTINTLKAENSELRKQIFYGFTSEDDNKVREWYIAHRSESERMQKTSHSLSYIMYPSELGPIKTVKCSCGEELDLTKEYEFG
jgi:hypothetical protein